jgi:hypothetical protein
MNGYLAEETGRMVAEIVPWLRKEIVQFHPGSSYARSARNSGSAPSSDSSSREDRRPSDPPALWRAQATPVGMDELFAFVCSLGGNSVEVPKPLSDCRPRG